MDTNQTELGPIDVVVIGYAPGAPMTGESIPIFLELADRGTIKVLDVRFVRKHADGTYAGVDPADLDADAAGDLANFAGAASGLISEDDVARVAAEIEPGGTAVMIVYENRWAAPFVAAARRNGGELIFYDRIHVQDLIDALDAAEAAA